MIGAAFACFSLLAGPVLPLPADAPDAGLGPSAPAAAPLASLRPLGAPLAVAGAAAVVVGGAAAWAADAALADPAQNAERDVVRLVGGAGLSVLLLGSAACVGGFSLLALDRPAPAASSTRDGQVPVSGGSR